MKQKLESLFMLFLGGLAALLFIIWAIVIPKDSKQFWNDVDEKELL